MSGPLPWLPDAVSLSALAYAEGPVTPLNADVLLEMLRQSDEKHEDGHHRLRTDIRLIESRLEKLEQGLNDQRTTFASLPPPSAPVEITRLRFPATVVFTMIVGCLGVGFTIYASTQAILTRMETQKVENDTANQVQNANIARMREIMDDFKKGQELQRIQIESVAKNVISQGRR